MARTYSGGEQHQIAKAAYAVALAGSVCALRGRREGWRSSSHLCLYLLPMRYGWGRTLPPLPARLDDAVLDGLLAPHTRRAVLAAAQLAFYVQILI